MTPHWAGCPDQKYIMIGMEYFVSGFWVFSGELSESGQESLKGRVIWSFVGRIFHNNVSQ